MGRCFTRDRQRLTNLSKVGEKPHVSAVKHNVPHVHTVPSNCSGMVLAVTMSRDAQHSAAAIGRIVATAVNPSSSETTVPADPAHTCLPAFKTRNFHNLSALPPSSCCSYHPRCPPPSTHVLIRQPHQFAMNETCRSTTGSPPTRGEAVELVVLLSAVSPKLRAVEVPMSAHPQEGSCWHNGVIAASCCASCCMSPPPQSAVGRPGGCCCCCRPPTRPTAGVFPAAGCCCCCCKPGCSITPNRPPALPPNCCCC